MFGYKNVDLGITNSFCIQFSSVAESCPSLCNPMDYRMPGFPVYHHIGKISLPPSIDFEPEFIWEDSYDGKLLHLPKFSVSIIWKETATKYKIDHDKVPGNSQII